MALHMKLLAEMHRIDTINKEQKGKCVLWTSNRRNTIMTVITYNRMYYDTKFETFVRIIFQIISFGKLYIALFI